MNSTQPHVGQILDYYPDNHTRLAAICIQVHSSNDIGSRPMVNLSIFNPDGSQDIGKDIEAVDPNLALVNPEDVNLSERWGFSHEFFLAINDAESDANSVPLGTKSNLHVGTITVLY